MADNTRHNYNGRYRLHTNEMREDTMETNLIPDTDWRDLNDVTAGMKSYGAIEEPRPSLHQVSFIGSSFLLHTQKE